jgi:hypothetical protein
VPSWYSIDEIEYPPSANFGQSSSETTARFKANLLDGEAIADLCGGAGVDAWFMAQKASGYLFNEPDEELLKKAEHNFALLPAQNPHISFLSKIAEQFTGHELSAYSAIYLDPSRRKDGGARAWNWAAMQPDLTQMPWLWEGPWSILIKLSPGQDFTEVERHLPYIPIWFVLSVGDEVKELLAYLPKSTQPIQSLPIGHRRILELEHPTRTYDFNPLSIKPAFLYTEAKEGQYLLEPSGALLKAGAQDAYAASLGIKSKLDPNTHLYLSEAQLPNWWGKAYLIKRRLLLSPKELQAVGPCQVSGRNFGLEPDAIRKKYNLKAGDKAHLFFFQDAAGYRAAEVERIEN